MRAVVSNSEIEENAGCGRNNEQRDRLAIIDHVMFALSSSVCEALIMRSGHDPGTGQEQVAKLLLRFPLFDLIAQVLSVLTILPFIFLSSAGPGH